MNHRENEAEQELQGGLASVGATLRAAREEQERSLESVAADLHLQVEIVRAIETGDEGKLTALLNLLKPMGIKKIARTGTIALMREPK